MNTILETSVPPDSFALGQALESGSGVTITLERVVPTGGRGMPRFWASDGDLDRFETQVRADPSVQTLRRERLLDGAGLYYAEWADQVHSLLAEIAAERGTILSGVCTDTQWTFILRFPDRDRLPAFRDRCDRAGICLRIDRILTVTDPAAAECGITSKQRETLLTAYENGYFEVPRNITQEELARELDVKSSAVSETLRRGIGELIHGALVGDSPANHPR